MEKTIKLVVLLLITWGAAQAQSENKYSIGFGFQYNAPERWFSNDPGNYSGKNEGAGIYLEAKRKTTERIRVGAKAEYAFVTENARTDDIGTYEIVSLVGTGQYYFTGERAFSPFIGLGAGAFHVLRERPAINFGVEAVIGIRYQMVQLSVGYDRIVNRIDYRYNIKGGFDNYYLPIRLGLEF